MKDFFKEMGYVMVSRALLMRMFERRGKAEGDEEAFLRILVYANYKPSEADLGHGRKVVCQRGDSMKSFLRWGQILGWGRTRVRRFFSTCFHDGLIIRVQDGSFCHIRIPAYDAWMGIHAEQDSESFLYSSPENLPEVSFKAAATFPPAPTGASSSESVSPNSSQIIDLARFMEHYSEVTQTPLLNIGRAQRYWNRLTANERRQAYEQVDDYYMNLSDIRYCMQAATYLRDKAYLNRYDY